MYFGINRPRNLNVVAKRKSRRERSVVTALQLTMLFIPGVFFVVTGLVAFLAPQLLVAAVAGFFLFVGFCCCFLAWKFVEFKKRFENLVRNFEARVIVQNTNPVHYSEDDPEMEMKKVIFH